MKVFPMQAAVLGNSVPRKLSYNQKARKALAFLSHDTEISASNLYVHKAGSISCGSTVTCHQLALEYSLWCCTAFAGAEEGSLTLQSGFVQPICILPDVVRAVEKKIIIFKQMSTVALFETSTTE